MLIDCAVAADKTWDNLLNRYDSPFNDSKNTICFPDAGYYSKKTKKAVLPEIGEQLWIGNWKPAPFLKKKKPGFLWRCCATKIPADSHMIIFWKLSKKAVPFLKFCPKSKRALRISPPYLAEPVQKAYQRVFASMELLKTVLTFYPRESNNYPVNLQ